MGSGQGLDLCCYLCIFVYLFDSLGGAGVGATRPWVPRKCFIVLVNDDDDGEQNDSDDDCGSDDGYDERCDTDDYEYDDCVDYFCYDHVSAATLCGH